MAYKDTLYNVMRESHPKEVASSRFGNLLLFLPNIMVNGSGENIVKIKIFSGIKNPSILK
jgi:hypothetical protein